MDTLAKFRRRVEATTSKDASAGFMFDSVTAHAEKRVGVETANKMREAVGLPKKVIPLFKYPIQPLLKFVVDVSDKAARGNPFDRELQGFGVALIESFMLTPMGKTLLSLNRGNVHRLMKAAVVGYQTGMNFGKRSYDSVSDNEGVMSFKGELLGPGLQEAIVVRGIELGCGVRATVSSVNENDSGTDFTLKIRW